jgi:hypothetical protein
MRRTCLQSCNVLTWGTYLGYTRTSCATRAHTSTSNDMINYTDTIVGGALTIVTIAATHARIYFARYASANDYHTVAPGLLLA